MEATAPAHAGELECARYQQRDRRQREMFEPNVVQPLTEMAMVRVAVAEQHCSEPAKHRQRPEREALASVVGDDWRLWFVHALEFSAAASRSD